MDNAVTHRSTRIKDLTKNSNNHLLYSVLYNPATNAIEEFFSQMKHYLKLYKSKNFEELKLNLIKSIKNIKKEHYENYFTYAYNKDSYKKKKIVKNLANIEY